MAGKNEITFTGTVKTYESRWYYGFYKVKPEIKINNPDKPKPSNALVWLMNKPLEEIYPIKKWDELLGARVRVTGYWHKDNSLQKKSYFKLTNFERVDA